MQNDPSRFREIEEGEAITRRSPEELECEGHFKNFTKPNPDGRYPVSLLFNSKRNSLRKSYFMALRRFQSLKRHFSKDTQLTEYTRVIEKYLSLGYVAKLDAPSQKGLYLPHRAVVNKCSMTTKLRVVFDGLATSSTGISLNDVSLGGPTIQDDISSLFIRFRLHRHALTGDIEKIYLLKLQKRIEYITVYYGELRMDLSLHTYLTFDLRIKTCGLSRYQFYSSSCNYTVFMMLVRRHMGQLQRAFTLRIKKCQDLKTRSNLVITMVFRLTFAAYHQAVGRRWTT